MTSIHWCIQFRIRRAIGATMLIAMVASCTDPGLPDLPEWPEGFDAPGIDPKGTSEDPLVVGNRLLRAGEYDLALDSLARAALDQGMTAEIMAGMGTANLGLRQLGPAETLLRRSVKENAEWSVAWNNLGVVLMERREYPEAAQSFKRAFALDDGESDAIRDNLRLALAKMENPVNTDTEEQEYTLEQQGNGQFKLRKLP